MLCTFISHDFFIGFYILRNLIMGIVYDVTVDFSSAVKSYYTCPNFENLCFLYYVWTCVWHSALTLFYHERDNTVLCESQVFPNQGTLVTCTRASQVLGITQQWKKHDTAKVYLQDLIIICVDTVWSSEQPPWSSLEVSSSARRYWDTVIQRVKYS